MTMRKNSAISMLTLVPTALAAMSIMLIAGCGGGGSTNTPSVSTWTVTANPNPMGYLGGKATVVATVSDPVGIDPSTVKVDLVDSTGASIISGPQMMQKSLTITDSYSYVLNVPNNLTGTSNKVYTVKVMAADIKGVGMLTPAVLGNVTVPFPPPPPSGP